MGHLSWQSLSAQAPSGDCWLQAAGGASVRYGPLQWTPPPVAPGQRYAFEFAFEFVFEFELELELEFEFGST
ncbi:hypothetical protein AWZ03_003840 [Drosophila navojoa]|uniref:Uncharacterized protein n=1 Tax=Drosophila navojoa TaxID=7232 RepID=A0A484BN38_DRONA|nr:hypothetical protein AWZ03_003840 [Drosophila navojoa]